jgi:short-chain fatty acids transporter
MIKRFGRILKTMLPTPFSIALLLTALTFILAFTLTSSSLSGVDRVVEVLGFWEQGLWDKPLLAFAVQMMLMLVLGHALALTKPVDSLMSYATRFCTSTARAAAIVTFLTVIVSLFNWGLGLIFGAILARKVGEHTARLNGQLNYALIGAAGYSGLMVWHAGISGSAPIKAAEQDHLAGLMGKTMSAEQLELLPKSITFSDTVFGSMNLVAMLLLILVLPAFMYWLGKRTKKMTSLPQVSQTAIELEDPAEGAEKLDVSRLFSLFFGLLIVTYSIYLASNSYGTKGFGFITPNFINLLLLGLCLSFHQNIRAFLKAIDKAIGGSSGILIQFPLYFGILGIMTNSGLVQQFSDFFVRVSTETTFPIYTFFSAGLVNIFVPSGGGQWGVQGPIIIQASMELGVSLPKAIMALAYGDQLTNMLQPFWALPLLGITGLKANNILPYTLALMGVGIVIFISVLLMF